jgi:nitroreductase
MLCEILRQRRSVRKYLTKEPPKEWLKDLINCGRSAPSPSNRQPVRVRQIVSEKAREELHRTMLRQKEHLINTISAQKDSKRVRNYIRAYYRYSEFMFTAPWLILIGTADVGPGFKDHLIAAGLHLGKSESQIDEDITVGLFVSAMLLRATELGLGSCILTAPLVFLAMEKNLTLFHDIFPKCFVTFGYAAEAPAVPPRFDLADIFKRC